MPAATAAASTYPNIAPGVGARARGRAVARGVVSRAEAGRMLIVNTDDIDELEWSSPKGRFGGRGKQVSEALGRKPASHNLDERHPFDVEIERVAPGATPCPYHSHSAQWEFFHVIAGSGSVRHAAGREPIRRGDAFLFKPGEAHQIINDGVEDLILYIVADNPIGESHHYPDSGKWSVASPQGRIIRSEPLDYFDGEE